MWMTDCNQDYDYDWNGLGPPGYSYYGAPNVGAHHPPWQRSNFGWNNEYKFVKI